MPKSEQEQFRELLRGSEFLQRTFEAILDGILVVGRDGRIIYANPSAESLLGLPREDLVGTQAKALPLSMYDRGGDKVPVKSRPFAAAWNEEGEPPSPFSFRKPDDSLLIPAP